MANVQYYDVILKPVVTEKTMELMGDKKYTFLVHPDANKTMNKEGYRTAYSRQQRYRDLPGSLRSLEST